MPLYSLSELASFAAAVSIGVFVQSATGFAGGLVIIPLMLWFGHGLPEAQAALLTSTIPQNSLGVYRFREHINLFSMRWPILLRCISLPLGVLVLYSIEDFPKTFVRQIVSGVVLACVVLLVSLRPSSREEVPFRWTLLAFLSSGFFAGLTATGGPMMVLWVQSHDWTTERVRSFLFVMYLLSIPISLGLLFYSFGNRIVVACTSAIVLLPLVLVVSQLGLLFGSRLGKARLKRVTMAMLFLLGLIGLLSPWVTKVLGRN